ncbi:hypothetical protein DRN73_10150 [Candidatus Pacearchaeota archaeon]|nr:MAG: hypothetical protein DRN73_10150 [Candidatus Pacearchaeota archaeon]
MPPVKEGEEIDVKIESIGAKGDGIAKVKGFVVFVKGVEKNETCRIKITKVLDKVGFGEKIGPAQGPVEEERQEIPEPPVEEEPEDTENFGEELDEE